MDSALSWCAAMLGDLQYLSNEMVSNPGLPLQETTFSVKHSRRVRVEHECSPVSYIVRIPAIKERKKERKLSNCAAVPDQGSIPI